MPVCLTVCLTSASTPAERSTRLSPSAFPSSKWAALRAALAGSRGGHALRRLFALLRPSAWFPLRENFPLEPWGWISADAGLYIKTSRVPAGGQCLQGAEGPGEARGPAHAAALPQTVRAELALLQAGCVLGLLPAAFPRNLRGVLRCS